MPKRSSCSELTDDAARGVSTSVLSKPKTEPTPLIGSALSEPVTTISSVSAAPSLLFVADDELLAVAAF